MTPPNPLADFAAQELDRRTRALLAAVRSGDIGHALAATNLNRWMAIACAAGVEHPEFETVCLWPPGAKGRAFPGDFAPTHEWRAELERARDAANARLRRQPGNTDALNQAIRLNQLARHLGCKPITLPGAQPAGVTPRKAA